MRIIVVDFYGQAFNQTQLHLWDSALRYVIPTFEEIEEIFPAEQHTQFRIVWVVGVLDPQFKFYNSDLADSIFEIKMAAKPIGFLPTQSNVFLIESISLTKPGIGPFVISHDLLNKHLPYETGTYRWEWQNL
jgi:hypothetical protein